MCAWVGGGGGGDDASISVVLLSATEESNDGTKRKEDEMNEKSVASMETTNRAKNCTKVINEFKDGSWLLSIFRSHVICKRTIASRFSFKLAQGNKERPTK